MKDLQPILEARARRLAATTGPIEVREDYPVLAFERGHERYGVAPGYVREVAPLTVCIPVPGTPPFVQGIMSLRGEILSVLDLLALFERPTAGLPEYSRVIVLRDADMWFGLLADKVQGLVSVAPEGLAASFPAYAGRRTAWFHGVTPDGLAILDGGQLLHDRDLVVHRAPLFS